MTITVITFDLDNTLWDMEPAILRAEQAQRQWLLKHRPGAIENTDHEELWELKKWVWKRHPELTHNVSGTRKMLLQELQQAAGYDQRKAEEGAEAAFAAFMDERHRVDLYEDVLHVLDALAVEFRLGALTNGNADVYKTAAGAYFDFAVLAEHVGASKPAPDMFHAALELTGTEPQQVLHVGDSPEHDVLAAMDVGMRAVWVNAGGDDWPHSRRPEGEISRLRELPALIRTLNSP